MNAFTLGLGAALALLAVKTAVAQSTPGGIIQSGPNAKGIVINKNNITIPKSPAEEAAERVQACEVQHGMKTASEKTVSEETIRATYSGDQDQYVQHIIFRSCAWPRSLYGDLDGYFEIKIESVEGPGDSEASGTNRADRISAPCPRLRVAYQFGHMGDYKSLNPFIMSADTVATAYGERWTRPNGNVSGYLPFYPERGEFVVLHNDNDAISIAECL
jgi:hypothetical protein